jgi:hypothetical protein
VPSSLPRAGLGEWVSIGFPVPMEPLPARFQLSDLGKPVPVVVSDSRAGTGAGGGCGTGPVHLDCDPPEGAVLVVRTLDPALAAVLPRLAGLVAESGSRARRRGRPRSSRSTERVGSSFRMTKTWIAAEKA